MSVILEISEDQFEKEVLQSAGPVLVDFGAVWCHPCKMLDPLVHELAGEWGSRVKVVKVDVDHNPTAAMTYRVMSVPTLLLFKHGQEFERLVGYKPKDQIAAKFSPHFQE